MKAEELLKRYAAGEKDFSGAGLDDVKVIGFAILVTAPYLHCFFAPVD
ncbi:MAG: hypothetical protein AAGD25_22385 [Cyanobacteria bacterium P01_F01_bin.150]